MAKGRRWVVDAPGMPRQALNLAAAAMSRATDRRYPRVRVGLPPCREGRLLDLSASGARVRCGRRAMGVPGDRLILAVGEGADAIELDCRVVWSRGVGFRRGEMGLEFAEPVRVIGGRPMPMPAEPGRRRAA